MHFMHRAYKLIALFKPTIAPAQELANSTASDGKRKEAAMKLLRAMREPLKYVQGKDAMLQFHSEMAYMGNRWLFICSRSGYSACHDNIEASFGTSEDYRRYEIFGGVSSNSEIAKMQSIVKEDSIDTVVAVGGGSAVDTAKATAYYTGKRVVIIPTVAATDAPCTGLSVIYNDDGSFDKYLFYPTNPDAVMVDSTVIANAPTRFLVAGMGDALGTFFEGRASIRTESPSLEGTGITRAGMALAELCYKTLRDYGSQAIAACNANVVTPALDAIIETNVYLSGVGADNVNCAAAHSFYNGLTTLGGHSAPHGCCVAFGTLVQLTLEGATKEEFEDVQSFCLEVGLPVTLAELGVTNNEQVRTIAENACVPGETIHNLAGDVTPDELYAAILATDALGRSVTK